MSDCSQRLEDFIEQVWAFLNFGLDPILRSFDQGGHGRVRLNGPEE